MNSNNKNQLILTKFATYIFFIFMKIPLLSMIIRRRNMVKYATWLGVQVGTDCRISGCSFGSEPYLITIGNHVSIGAGVQFITHDGGVWVLRVKDQLKNVDRFGMINVGDNVFIGDSTIILPGVTIGNNVIVGAGSVVSGHIPSNSVVAGVPARVVKTILQYEEEVAPILVRTKGMSLTEKRQYLITNYQNIKYR